MEGAYDCDRVHNHVILRETKLRVCCDALLLSFVHLLIICNFGHCSLLEGMSLPGKKSPRKKGMEKNADPSQKDLLSFFGSGKAPTAGSSQKVSITSLLK
jgi:hypothetical protein